MAEEQFLRPEAAVLSEESVIPPRNLVRPPPNRFTHRLTAREPFSFRAGPDSSPDGWLDEGAEVVLMVDDGGPRCWVVDGRGLYVEVGRQSLRPM